MPRLTECPYCHGKGNWCGDPCTKCKGSGQVAPFRRALNWAEGLKLGWGELNAWPLLRDEGCCASCNKKLTGRKTSYCSKDCRAAHIFRVWKGAHWQKRAVACRDGHACRTCGEVFEEPIQDGGKPYCLYSMLELDHIRPLHLGGTEAPENCQLLCKACHQRKTVAERRPSEGTGQLWNR